MDTMISSIVWAGRRKTQPLQKSSPNSESAVSVRMATGRMWLVLKKRGIHRNPKTILRVMKKYGVACGDPQTQENGSRWGSKSTSTRICSIGSFMRDRPNSKWVTDISYIHTKQGVLYLSMIRDLYDNSIVAYKTATQQTVNLVLDTIRLAMKEEEESRCGVAPPQRPRLSIHFASIFQADTRLRHYAFHVKTWKLVMTMLWRKISFPFSRQSVSTAINRPHSARPMR